MYVTNGTTVVITRCPCFRVSFYPSMNPSIYIFFCSVDVKHQDFNVLSLVGGRKSASSKREPVVKFYYAPSNDYVLSQAQVGLNMLHLRRKLGRR